MEKFKIDQRVKIYMDNEPYTGIITKIHDISTVEVEINDTFSITVDKNKVINDENKFKVGDLVSYRDSVWFDDGVVVDYSTNFVGRKLVHVRDSHGSELVFYEHEVRLRKG